jgi:hypothetical protein
MQAYILGQTIPKFSFNGLRTFSEYRTTKKNFVTVKTCASFHLTLVFACSAIQLKCLDPNPYPNPNFFLFGFGKKFRILSDSDPYH